MVVLNGSANRDDRAFPDSEAFDISRKADRHLSFGHGLHSVSAALARLEGRIALEEVLARFPEWDVDWEAAKLTRTSTDGDGKGWRAGRLDLPGVITKGTK